MAGRANLVEETVLARLRHLASDDAPRTLVVLAHPDDEVLAVGGTLERWREARFVCVTDGAPGDGEDARAHGFSGLDEYRRARRGELLAALAHGGIPATQAEALWLSAADGGGLIADQRASHHLAAMARAVLSEMRAFQPDAVLTHPFEGGHPDHDACAFAVHAAVESLSGAAVPILEAPSYHAGPHGLVTGEFLPYAGAGEVVTIVLNEAQRRDKRERLACFGSQRETLAQFGCEVERFRLAPRYDFLRAPHAGQLWYERWPWGMSGERFCALAQEALEELGLSETSL